MGKVSELSMLVDGLKKCGETLIGISEGLADMFGSAEEEKPPAKKAAPKKKLADEPEPKPQIEEEKPFTLEDVRAVCADKSRKGFTAEVKAILTKHGADKLSEVDPAEYKALLAEVEVLGNAKIVTQYYQHPPVTDGWNVRPRLCSVPKQEIQPVSLPCRAPMPTAFANTS